MLTEQLQLKFSARRQHESHAWLLPGDNPAEWLSEITTWTVPLSAVRLLIVPASRQDRTPLGALAILDRRETIIPSRRAYAYGCLAEQLYLPCEAVLEPAIRESELGRLLTNGRRYVWHPRAGLIGFDTDEITTIEDLLAVPTPRTGQWDFAETGPGYARRLTTIESIAPLHFEEILQSGREDIGTQSDGLADLPPLPDESPAGGSIGDLFSAPKRAAARFAKWLTDQAPSTADGTTWVDRLENWANRVLSPELQSARARELARLLNLLKENPDEGLKYALPMSGDAARGIAPPSARLGPRNVDFRLGFGGGGPVDPWGVPHETHMRLVAEYRQLAAREIQLGRHRRAAYIYAELLGDINAAVGALKGGGFYREAAVLCKERLKRRDKAAECLEEGGLWDEALKEYEALNHHEKCGAILRRLGEEERAVKSYHMAAMRSVAEKDFLKAARILDKECSAPDAARNILQRGWKHEPQAAECLKEELQLLAREGLHEDTKRRVMELTKVDSGRAATLRLAEVLAESAGDYPDERIREFTADRTRVVVSRELVKTRDDTPDSESRKFLRAVEKLAKPDRLLHRDCERYYREWSTTRQNDTYPLVKRGTVELMKSVQLDDSVSWQRSVATNRYLYFAGFRKDRLILTRLERSRLDAVKAAGLLLWSGSTTQEGTIFLAPSPNDSKSTWIYSCPGAPLRRREFMHPPKFTETPPWCHPSLLGLAQSINGLSWMITAGPDPEFLLSVYSSDGVPMQSRNLPFTARDFNRGPLEEVPLHARSNGIFLGVGEQVLWLDSTLKETVFSVTGNVQSMCGSPAHARVRVAVSFPSGGAVVWKDTRKIQNFGNGLVTPKTAMTQTGKLVAVDDSKLELYDTSHGDVTFLSSVDSPGKPVSVVAYSWNNFAVLCADGRLQLYQVTE